MKLRKTYCPTCGIKVDSEGRFCYNCCSPYAYYGAIHDKEEARIRREAYNKEHALIYSPSEYYGAIHDEEESEAKKQEYKNLINS